MSHTTFIILFVILWVAYLVYVFVKNKQAKASVDLEAERQRYEEHKAELLDKHFPKLKAWMKDKPIDAFAVGNYPDSKANQVKNIALDGAKKLAASAVGIKLRIDRVETDKFFVLSGEEVHFLATDVDGKLDTHLVFGKERLEAASLRSIGAKPVLGVMTKSAKEDLPQVYRITFDIDGRELSLDIYDRFNAEQFTQEGMGFMRPNHYLDIVKGQVVGEGFLAQLMERYPHLKEEHLS